MRKKALCFLVVFILVGFSYSLYAQILTGTIKGTVKDEAGEALPGVSVELRSPALIGGPRSTLTSARGIFFFSNLPPGVYELAFSLSGFQTLKREKIQVRVDSTVTEDVVLSTEVIQESVTVVATNPVVDVTKSGISTNWQTEMMESLPFLRYTFFDVVNSTPGVWSHGGNTDDSRSVAFGSGADSNTYLFDGVDTTSPDYGAGWSWLNPDVVEEIQIIGIGGKAEYGNFMGATVNIVTKSGGNQFRGEVGGYLQTSGLTGNNSEKYLKDLLDNGYITEEQQFGYHREKFYDASFQLGGPLIKDRIWFYLAGWLHNDASSSAGVNPSGYTSTKETQFFIKTTIQATNNLKLSGFYNYEKFDLPDAFTPAYASKDSVSTEIGLAPAASFSLSWVLSDRTYFELKYNYSGGHDYYESITGYKGPSYYDYNTDTWSGGPSYEYFMWSTKHGINATVSHFAEDFLTGDHDFKFGVQYAHGKVMDRYGYSAGLSYATYVYDYYGYTYLYEYKYEWAPYQYGATSNQLGLFVDDTWSVTDWLTLNIGLRYDRNTGSIPDMPILGVNPVTYEWYETGATVPGKSNVVDWKVFSPRIGLAFKLTKDGKTLFRANYGRYYDHLIYGNFYQPSPASTTWYMYEWTGEDWDYVTSYAPELISINPNLKNPYSDQLSFGFDRELFSNFGVSLTYLEKWTHDQIGFYPLNGTWEDYYELVTVADPYTGDSLQVYNLIGDYPEVQITNPDMFYSRFRMFSLVATKRMANRWQLSASLTLSKMWGLNPRGVSRQTDSQNILWNSSSARDPNSFLNLDGRLPGDRPFSIKVAGTYLLPFDISFSMNLQVQAGSPYCRTATIYGLNQGSVTVATEERGANDHRLPTGALLDVNVEKAFRIQEGFSIHVRFDIFNLLNDGMPYGMQDYSLIPGRSWVYSSIWAPRRAQLGLRVRF
jgi:outer membrane receptor protein involved in Fe transport